MSPRRRQRPERVKPRPKIFLEAEATMHEAEAEARHVREHSVYEHEN